MTGALVTSAAGTSRAPGETVFCFDVFDTVLTRAVGDPNHVFLLLGRRLLARGTIPCSAEIFARQRMLAENRANDALGHHATLERIQRELAQAIGLAGSAVDDLVAAELQIERDLSRKLPAAESLLSDARLRGQGAVTFVTDTNMPAAFVRELLERQGLWGSDDRLFASCEMGVDKARGMMFPLAAKTLGVHPRRILHHGNDPVADLRNGKMSAWRVRHLDEANPNRFEKALSAEAFSTGGLTSIFAGASRLARLARPGSGRDATIRAVTAGVMAPALTGWMIWTLRRAVELGLGRLYFISRDGQVLLDIAARLDAVMRTGLDLRYLYGGRQVVQFAGAPQDTLHSLMRLEFCSVEDLLEVTLLTDEQTAELLPQELRSRANWKRNTTAAERQEIAARADTDPLRGVIQSLADGTRGLLLDYLRQEGWGDGIPFGLVDVGWRGSMAHALAVAVEGSSLAHPERHLYFGLADDSRRVGGPIAGPRMEAWFFDDAIGQGFLPYLPSNTSLIEMFCAGDHGAVVGYRRRDGRVEPVLRTDTSPMKEWGLPLLRETAADFVDAFVAVVAAFPELVELRADPRQAVNRVLDQFWLDPTPAEVRHWGTFPVEVTLNNSRVLPLAEPAGIGKIVRSIMDGKPKLRSLHSWPRGTVIASPRILGAALSVAFSVRDKLPRLRRRARWIRLQAALLLAPRQTKS